MIQVSILQIEIIDGLMHIEFESPVVGFDVYDYEGIPTWLEFTTLIGTLNLPHDFPQ